MTSKDWDKAERLADNLKGVAQAFIDDMPDDADCLPLILGTAAFVAGTLKPFIALSGMTNEAVLARFAKFVDIILEGGKEADNEKAN